jgi:hypothetical protein
MKLFRQNHEQINDEPLSNNPFLRHKDPDIRQVHLVLEAESIALEDPDSYSQAITTALHQFPWFSQFHLAPVHGIDYELRRKTVPALRRILVSYLAGRPMEAVAKRVPTSRRTVYKTIEREIYSPYGDLDSWSELGLIRTWDLPQIPFYVTVLQEGFNYEEECAVVVCLLCHRLVGNVVLHDRLYDSSIVAQINGRFEAFSYRSERIRGHLIAHFYFGERPTPNQQTMIGYDSRDRLQLYTAKGGWMDHVALEVAGIAGSHQERILPVTESGTPTESEVRDHYRGLL